MSAAAISRSPVTTLVPEEPPKRAKKDEVEEKGQHPEPESLAYDPAPLCGAIYLELLEGRQPRLAADQIVRSFPDILLSLASLSPQQVVDLVKHHIALSEYERNQQRNILTTVLILYSTSLVNSSIGEGAKRLESSELSARPDRGEKSELRVMLELSEKPHAAALIRKAREVLQVRVQPDIQGLQGQIGVINQVTDAVNTFLNLFFYHAPSNRERFENLFTYSNQFPNCGRLFPRLMQNLNICQHEYGELVALRRELHAQTMDLQARIGDLQAPRVQKLPESREQMLEHQTVLLWEAGTELLEQGLTNVFLDKRKYRTYIPDPFRDAINTASRPQEFRALNFNTLLANRIDRFPPQFVSAVWDHYRGESSRIVDISDLMRHIIGSLPEPFFKQLEADLKTSADKKKTLITALHQYFRAEFRGRSFTLTALKDWL